MTQKKLQERLFELIGADRWVNGAYPAVEPVNADEVSHLLKGYPGPVIVVGNGTNFSADFDPGDETLVLLTRKLNEAPEVSHSNQVLTVQSGCSVNEINGVLSDEGFIVPALSRFEEGTVGGRLSSVSSRPNPEITDGWIQSLLGLEVVLPSGEILKLGGCCIKDVAGYDLKHLFTGTRGSAGVIVTAIFRCLPINSYSRNIQSPPPHSIGRFDTQWRRLIDPMGRMRPGA